MSFVKLDIFRRNLGMFANWLRERDRDTVNTKMNALQIHLVCERDREREKRVCVVKRAND